MLQIETQGSWLEMARQYGEAFRDPLHECVGHFCPWLNQPLDKAEPFLKRTRSLLERRCPALLDETRGMAEGAGLDERQILAYRFFPDVAAAMSAGCSLVYLGRSDAGPLLARNADLEDDISQRVQVCHVSRPDDGPATLTLSYVGLLPINGCNDRGLGLVAASAHTTECGDDRYGIPAGVLMFEALQTDSTTDATHARFAAEPFAGKSCNLLVGDAQGDSAVLEMVPGHPARRRPQPPGRDWNASTNTFLSGRYPIPDEPEYQQCSYARYGRIAQPLTDGQMDYRLDAVDNLMKQIAMPGPVCTGFGRTWKTAYTTVICLQERRVVLYPGHPAETESKVIRL